MWDRRIGRRGLENTLLIVLLTIIAWSMQTSAKVVASPLPQTEDAKDSSGESETDEPTDEPNELDELNQAGFSALHYAAMQGDPIKASELIANGADVNVQQGTFKGTPMQYAAHKGHVKVLQLLIAADAKLDTTDTAGRTPLMWAAHGGQARAVKVLVAAGADVNAATPKGWTPIMYARQADDQLSMQLLRDGGATDDASKSQSKPMARPIPKTQLINPLFSSPAPFISVKSDDSMETIKWSDVRATMLDVNVRTSPVTDKVDGNLVLPITILNDSDSPLRSRLAREWHGGEWPPTDLYASVTPAGTEKMSFFVPVYVHGENRDDSGSTEIPPGKSVKVNLRMDWPGTGGGPAEPLISARKGAGYIISVMMVFDVDGEKQYTISKLREVSTGEKPSSSGTAADDPPMQKGSPVDAKEVARRLKLFRREVEFLTVPPNRMPANYKAIESLPAVVIPGASTTDDSYFPVVSAFIGSDPSARDKIKAAIIVGFVDDRSDSQVGIYAISCQSSEAARELMRPGLIQKDHLLLYIWKDKAQTSALDAIRDYFAEKELGKVDE